MDLKKFISTISAVAISASAFAGMAVTASAATVTNNADNSITVSGITPEIDTKLDINETSSEVSASYFAASELTVNRWYLGSAKHGTIALMRFNVSDQLAEYTSGYVLSKAEVSYSAKKGTTSKVESYIGSIPGLSNTWDSTLTAADIKAITGNSNPATTVTVYNEEINANSFTSLTKDVTPCFKNEDDGIVTLAFWTYNGGRNEIIKTMESDSAPTVTLTFVPKVSKTINITAKAGTETLSTDSITGYVGTTYSYSPAAYLTVNDKFYKNDSLNDGRITGYSDKYADESSDIEVNYTEIAPFKYYAEAEDVTSNTEELVFSGSTYSNGKAAALQGGQLLSIGTYEPGVYRISCAYINNSNRGFFVRKADKTEIANIDLTQGTSLKSVEFTLKEATELYVSGYLNEKNQINQSCDFDYMYVERIGDYTALTQDYAIDKVDTYTGDADSNDILTLFKATLGNISGAITGVTIDGENVTEKITAESGTVLTDANVVLAIIVNKAAETAGITVTLD